MTEKSASKQHPTQESKTAADKILVESQQYQWLAQQLTIWRDKQLLSDNQASQISNLYYAKHSAAQSWATGILVAIGALLIGGGVIMLFAHNWEHLGKGARTILSFLPLVLAQALSIYSYKRQPNSSAWWEASATLIFMAIAASIALIGQTYHIYGDLERFILTWLILGLPLVYLLRSSMVLILCSILIVWLCTFEGKSYWLFFAALIPYWVYASKNQSNAAFYWSTWLAAIGFAIALMMSSIFRYSILSLYPVLFLLLMSAAYYLLGKLLFNDESHGFWKNPLASLGAIGIGLFSLIISSEDNRGHFERYREMQWDWAAYLDVALFFVALALILFGLVRYAKRFKSYQLVLIASGLVAVFALFDFAQWISLLGWLFVGMNLYILICSSLIIIRAIEEGKTLLLNGGLIWLSSLIGFRFFDSDLSILGKGIVFILIGCAFIGVNIWFNRKHKKQLVAEQETAHG
ncbi:MAG: DUF2157 domain-containing protein [Gammaproteobacteria bacterium]|nr:DUF2157 domain-containing protein [Gammaproteobacteria bacterium]